MSDAITLAYWDLRGWAEPIRYLLHYKKIKFFDKRYPYCERSQWLAEKFELGLDFPNMPYYLEGDVKLTQTLAILRYLAQKHGIDGRDAKQKLDVWLVEQQLIDFQRIFMTHILDEEHEAKRDKFVKKVQDQLKLYEKFVGSHVYLTGDSITYVDFMAYEMLDYYRLYEVSILNNFPTLKAYRQRIKNLPELQEYFNSATYKRWPIFGPRVKFGGCGPEPDDA